MGKKQTVPFPYRFRKSGWRRYEYIARRARDEGHNRLIRAMDNLLFNEGWEDKLTILRERQRKAGIPDAEFFCTQQRRAEGIKGSKFGRHVPKPLRRKRKKA